MRWRPGGVGPVAVGCQIDKEGRDGTSCMGEQWGFQCDSLRMCAWYGAVVMTNGMAEAPLIRATSADTRNTSGMRSRRRSHGARTRLAATGRERCNHRLHDKQQSCRSRAPPDWPSSHSRDQREESSSPAQESPPADVDACEGAAMGSGRDHCGLAGAFNWGRSRWHGARCGATPISLQPEMREAESERCPATGAVPPVIVQEPMTITVSRGTESLDRNTKGEIIDSAVRTATRFPRPREMLFVDVTVNLGPMASSAAMSGAGARRRRAVEPPNLALSGVILRRRRRGRPADPCKRAHPEKQEAESSSHVALLNRQPHTRRFAHHRSGWITLRNSTR